MTNLDQLKTCIEWCKDHGAIIDDRLEFKVTQDAGVTAIAKSVIKTTEPLISVPANLLITKELAEKEFGSASGAVSSENPNALVQLFTAKMKFDPSARPFHKPYFDILPTKLDQPYFWKLQEVELLKGTDIYLLMKQNLRKIVKEWHVLLDQLKLKPEDGELYEQSEAQDFDILKYICEYREQHKSISWKSFVAYLWATGIFTSRAFPKLVLEEKCSSINEAFLYPLVDLLNHKNDTKVKWTFTNDNVCFVSQEIMKEGEEVLNNYGEKSNEDLLLSYGFVQDQNPYDLTRLTLRLTKEMIDEALNAELGFSEKNKVADDCVQFQITAMEPLPSSMVNFFGYLCKLGSEADVTLRSFLEGQDQLHSILMQKLDFFRTHSKIDSAKYKTCNSKVLQVIRKYFNSEKTLFNTSLEALQKTQKEVLTKNSSMITSFKTIFKRDKQFANSLLLTFGVTKYDDLLTENCMKEALFLWIVRVANMDSYPQKFDFSVPQFIYDSFQEVSGSIVIERNNVSDFMDFYKKLFPGLSNKIPEVFSPGNWGIRQFIVADTVMDRLVWTRKLTQEPFFIVRVPFKL